MEWSGVDREVQFSSILTRSRIHVSFRARKLVADRCGCEGKKKKRKKKKANETRNVLKL